MKGVCRKVSDKNYLIGGAVCGLSAVLAWVLYAVGLAPVVRAAAEMDIVRRYENLAHVSPAVALVSWGGLAGALLSIPAVYAFYRDAVESRDNPEAEYSVLWVALVPAVVGLLFIMLSHAGIRFTLLYYFGREVISAGPEALPMLSHIEDALAWILSNLEFIGFFLAYGLGLFLFNLFGLRRGTIPAEFGWLGLAAGILGLSWPARYLFPGPSGWSVVICYLNLAAAQVWYLSLSLRILMTYLKAARAHRE